jgi:hypothetical protein
VLASVPDPDRRRAVLDDLADWRWLARLRADGVEAVRAAYREHATLGWHLFGESVD